MTWENKNYLHFQILNFLSESLNKMLILSTLLFLRPYKFEKLKIKKISLNYPCYSNFSSYVV